ncbi:MAG: outer membrane protein assembly factor BamA [Alphaproteobacteria bacterium]|nr:outer membrane protein assembly factor BamA [Alphaproteobacteria bacterium]
MSLLVRYLFIALFVLLTPARAIAFQPNAPEAQSFDAGPVFGAEAAAAPAESAPIISDVRVEGVQRIEADTVRSYLSLTKGDAATTAKMNDSVKVLFSTGFFSDVHVSLVEGNVLLVKVVENPVINRVVFEGNHAIETKDLEKEIQLKVRQVYTKSRVKSDTQRILDVYRRSGRFAVLVEPKVISLEQNRVDLVFEVTEGDRTGVRRINFIGNKVFGEDELRGAVNTRETEWWRFFSNSDFYDPDRLNYDKELLRRFYLNHGYVDFRVLSSHAELTPDRKDFLITFAIEEGEKYTFGKVDLGTTLKRINLDALRAKITTQTGDTYSAEKVEKTVAQLTAAIGDLQYGFAQVQPKLTPDKAKRTVDINYAVNEGPRVFVQRIDIAGNTRTLDRVIRRQMQLSEGDPFLNNKLKKSEQNIRDLGFFEEVKVTPSEGGQPDQSVIAVDVKEKSTGDFSIGAGFSSTDGPLGDFSINERNLLGKGQNLRFGIQASARRQQYDISFTEPYFLEKDLAVGGDLFRTTRDNQDVSSFNEERNGFNLRAGYALSDVLSERWNYGLTQTKITNVPTTASRFVREQQGTSITSLIGHELMYDKRNSKLNPTEGFYLKMNNDLAGVGGDVQFLRTKIGGAYYTPLFEKWTLNLGGEVGYIFGLGQDVRINDRFYLGGENLRGFKFAGVGPRDLTAGVNDALGGNRFARSRVEISFPTGLPEEFGVRGRVFNDAGILDQVDATALPGENFKADSKLRMSSGIGVTWQSPFGPIGVDLAQPILKESYDITEFFRFSFGTRF